MNYDNGTEAKLGDRVVARDMLGMPVAGVIVDLIGGSMDQAVVLPEQLLALLPRVSVSRRCLLAKDIAGINR